MKPKILVIPSVDAPDYLSDLVYLELYLSKDINLLSLGRPNYLFSDYSHPESLYGRGFTVCARLHHRVDDDGITFLDQGHAIDIIKNKIANKVVYTSIHRNKALWGLVTSLYKPQDIVVFDGEDSSGIKYDAIGKSLYYKRETPYVISEYIDPVRFSIPQDWIRLQSYRVQIKKNRLIARCDPRDRKTYTFYSEKEYYDQYSEALFGFTMKKAGWDCLRHYEIIISNCVPYFDGINAKPNHALDNYPKDLQVSANRLFDTLSKNIDQNFKERELLEYYSLLNRFRVWHQSNEAYYLKKIFASNKSFRYQNIKAYISYSLMYHGAVKVARFLKIKTQ